MNNQPPFAEADEFYSSSSKKFFERFLLFIAVWIFSSSASAQSPMWHYVGTLSSGKKVYLNDEIKSLARGNKTAWQKTVNADASSDVSLSEWNCAEKIRRTRQTSLYNPDESLIETQRGHFEWTRIVPGSSGEILHRRICLPAAPPVIAEITAPAAFLRALPDPDAQIIRIAERGARFDAVPESGKDGWFNLIDRVTQADYWVTADDLNILEMPPARVAPPADGNQQVRRKRGKTKARRGQRK